MLLEKFLVRFVLLCLCWFVIFKYCSPYRKLVYIPYSTFCKASRFFRLGCRPFCSLPTPFIFIWRRDEEKWLYVICEEGHLLQIWLHFVAGNYSAWVGYTLWLGFVVGFPGIIHKLYTGLSHSLSCPNTVTWKNSKLLRILWNKC